MEKRIVSATKPEACPICGARVDRILYGEPMMSEDEYFEKYHEHVIYGGCLITVDPPTWACSKCGTNFYVPPF